MAKQNPQIHSKNVIYMVQHNKNRIVFFNRDRETGQCG